MMSKFLQRFISSIVLIFPLCIVPAQPEAVFTLQMNDIYSIEFSMDLLNQFYTCLCDYQDQGCTVLLERDLAFTYVTRLVSVSRFPSFTNKSHQQVYSKNFVCTIPTSFNNDQMIGCIRLKNSENLCDNLELCESLNLIYGDTCDVGFAGVFWLYPGRIRQKIDNRYLSFSQCSPECLNTSSVQRSIIQSNPAFSQSPKKTPATTETVVTHSVDTPTGGYTVSYNKKTDATSVYQQLPIPQSETKPGFYGFDDDGKIIIITSVIIGILFAIFGIAVAGVLICRKKHKPKTQTRSLRPKRPSDPNTTLQFNLRQARQRNRQREVRNFLFDAECTSLSDFTADTPSTMSSQEKLVVRSKADKSMRDNLGVDNPGFLFDVNDNTFNSLVRHNTGIKKPNINEKIMESEKNAALKTISESVQSSATINSSWENSNSLFDDNFTVMADPANGLVYAKVDRNISDIFYDDYDFSNALDPGVAAAGDGCAAVILPLYAAVGEKARKQKNTYSRLNEPIRVLTNPYNKLTTSKDDTELLKKRLKPYSITQLYSPSSVAVVDEGFYYNDLVGDDELGDPLKKSGYVNFKYGAIMNDLPCVFTKQQNWTSSTLPQNLTSSSLPAQRHIYFELEKEAGSLPKHNN